MGIFDVFRVRSYEEEAGRRPAARSVSAPQAYGGSLSLNDPLFREFMAGGALANASGLPLNGRRALMNTAVFRSVSLIAGSIGMLPLHLIETETNEKADDHPLFPLLHREPNNWQSAFDFRTLMQMRVLVKGNAYAYVVRSMGRVIRLVPLDPDRVTPRQNPDWTVSYDYRPPSGEKQTFAPEEIFHLRGMSEDGINGMSLVNQARDAIALAIAAEIAVSRVYRNGSFVDGVLEAPAKLSKEAYDRLRDSWAERYGGAENAGKTPLLEEGLKYAARGQSARDAQSNETRGRQVEEVARVFGVPRPLLMVDETSWGSGVDVLGQFFVRYGLNPWFEAWQQAISRTLLVGKEKARFEAKFNPGGLLRGSMAQQGDFLAKALGAGGQQAFMTPNEARGFLDMPAHADGDKLTNPMTASKAGTGNDAKAA